LEKLDFMKWHGLGNDFVILDSRAHGALATAELARAVGDRHRGIGFDQLAEILPEDDGVKIEFWNSDGSRAGACGNATRCVAEYVMQESGATSLNITTARGALIAVRRDDGSVSVNMGQPQLDWQSIPLAHDVDITALPIEGHPIAVGMGNPHCVFFVEDAANVDPAQMGPAIESHPLFPERTNVEFASIRSDGTIRMRVWERGAGITLACGSGACATVVAAAMTSRAGRMTRIELDGGWLEIDWRDDGVWMTGPTTHVANASLSAAFLANI
jgi:diaminopimelate epimerase